MSGLQLHSDGRWRFLYTGRGRADAVGSGANAGLNESGASSFAGSTGGLSGFYVDPAEGSRLRLEGIVIVNDVAPGCNITLDLAPVSAAGGAAANVTVTVGAATTGSTVTFTTPAANSRTRSTVEFATPAAGFYVIRYTAVAPGMTASSAAVIRGTLAQR